jgi:UDP-N-acetylmuramoyl-L-alanyl-D-glutamate--2,6-diaminopimelate ligase
VGGRTEVRRRELGIAAAEYADFSILTDDNPDRESSADIISDIEKHMNGAPRIAIPNRKEAIEYAVSIAREGDIVLFAGKGHENYQLINGKKLPFSEKECILSAAEKLSVTKF